MKDINAKLAENTENLALAVSRFFGKPVEEVRSQLTENLSALDPILRIKKNQIQELEMLLKKKDKLEASQKAQEAKQGFLEIEKRVLDSLSPAKRKRVKKTRQELKKDEGNFFEISYRQFILKTANKEIIETEDTVQFPYAHKELYKQELQLPRAVLIRGTENEGKYIPKSSLIQDLLDKKNRRHHYIKEAIAQLEKEWKYIGTKENTFDIIMAGLEWTEKQKLQTIKYFTEFDGSGIVSLEKDEDDCRTFLCFGRTWRIKENMGFKKYKNPRNEGVLFVAKDC